MQYRRMKLRGAAKTMILLRSMMGAIALFLFSQIMTTQLSYAFAPRHPPHADHCNPYCPSSARHMSEISNTEMEYTTTVDSETNHPTDESTTTTTHIVFPGGGIYFYFQAGMATFLREQGYDISKCSFSGASAGALTATLSAANVDFYEATDLALSMAAKAGVWDRTGGLQGIWGPMIENWLDELLPSSIDSIQGRVTLLVTPVPSFGKTQISNFIDRQDLIRCNMASVHLPWFLDGNLTCNFRDMPHIDGSFLSKDHHYIPQDRETSTIVLDWKSDPSVQSKGGLDFVEALTPKGIYGLLDKGKSYGKVMEEQGLFESLTKL